MPKMILSIDIGSHAVRAGLVDEHCNILTHHKQSYPLNRFDSLRVEQDAALILRATQSVVSKTLEHAPSACVAAVLACQRSTVVAWNEQGIALSPALSWQDTRTKTALTELKAKESLIQKKSGLVLSPHYGASKMAWLENTLSEKQTKEGVYIGPLVSYLLFNLLENRPFICDECNAARTQLWNLNERRWDTELCDLFGYPIDRLPTVHPTNFDYGNLHQGSIIKVIPLKVVSGDQNVAFTEANEKITLSGTRPSHSALVNLGTGAFILRRELLQREENTSSEKKALLQSLSHGLFLRGPCLRGLWYSTEKDVHYLQEATVNGCGAALSWLLKQWMKSEKCALLKMGLDTDETQEKYFYTQLPAWLKKTQAPPLFINTIGGLGSPFWASDIAPHFAILDAEDKVYKPLKDHQSLSWSQKAKALIESIIFLIRINSDLLQQSNKDMNTLFCSGGITQIDGFCQNLANCCSMIVMLSKQSEATLIGAALQANMNAVSGFKGKMKKENFLSFKPENKPEMNKRYACFKAYLEKLVENNEVPTT